MQSQPYTPYSISIDADQPDLTATSPRALHHVLPGLLAFRPEPLTTPAAFLDRPETDTFGSDGFTPFDRI